MSLSIVSHLVAKDLRLVRPIVLSFALISLVSAGILSLMWGHVPFAVSANLGFIMLIGPAATCGIVVLMKTNVLEKEKATQNFIMSLPITVREFTRAKLLANLPVFAVFWGVVCAIGYYFAFARGLFPLGALPFVTMVFVGGFVAYSCILSVSLLTQSLGITVLCIALFEISTSAYMWAIAFYAPISRHIWEPVAVWNTEAIAVIAAQVLVAVTVLTATAAIQNTKRDFI